VRVYSLAARGHVNGVIYFKYFTREEEEFPLMAFLVRAVHCVGIELWGLALSSILWPEWSGYKVYTGILRLH